MNKIQLKIEGMSCEHCVAAVTEALDELPGVSIDEVRVGEARLSYDPNQVSPEQIALAVEDAGYAAHTSG